MVLAAALRRAQVQAEPALAVAVSRVVARTLVEATPAETLAEMTVMMVMMMSLTTRPLGQCGAAVQRIARQPFFVLFS
jgi:hypothetical protein